MVLVSFTCDMNLDVSYIIHFFSLITFRHVIFKCPTDFIVKVYVPGSSLSVRPSGTDKKGVMKFLGGGVDALMHLSDMWTISLIYQFSDHTMYI